MTQLEIEIDGESRTLTELVEYQVLKVMQKTCERTYEEYEKSRKLLDSLTNALTVTFDTLSKHTTNLLSMYCTIGAGYSIWAGGFTYKQEIIHDRLCKDIPDTDVPASGYGLCQT